MRATAVETPSELVADPVGGLAGQCGDGGDLTVGASLLAVGDQQFADVAPG